MKKLSIIILLFIGLFFTCRYVPLTETDIWDFEVPEECKNIKTLKELNMWVHNYITYDYDSLEMFRTPQEILEKQKEDCDGYTILFIGLAYKLFGYKCSCVKV